MKIALLIILFSINSFAFSSEWISPIDARYKTKNLDLFNKFNTARDLVNSWRGQSDKLASADKLLSTILEEDPQFAPAYREYGRIHIMNGYIHSEKFKEGSLDLSEKFILKSIEIEPKYADAYVLLGHLYTLMKKYKEAQISLEKAESIGTKNPWLNLNWASLLIEEKQYSKALQQYINVLFTQPSDKKAYLTALSGLTKLYEISGDFENARIYFTKQIEYEPESAWILGNYAHFLLFSYGDIDEAIKNGEKALQIMNYEIGRLVLACALYTKWAIFLDDPIKRDNAQQYFDQAWSIYPHLTEIIEKTKAHKHTNVTARKLHDLLEEKQMVVNRL